MNAANYHSTRLENEEEAAAGNLKTKKNNFANRNSRSTLRHNMLFHLGNWQIWKKRWQETGMTMKSVNYWLLLLRTYFVILWCTFGSLLNNNQSLSAVCSQTWKRQVAGVESGVSVEHKRVWVMDCFPIKSDNRSLFLKKKHCKKVWDFHSVKEKKRRKDIEPCLTKQ